MGKYKSYRLLVDYDRSIESGVMAGHYDWASSLVTSHNFPTRKKGGAEIEVILVRLNGETSTEMALRKIKAMGCRRADIQELLAFGEKYPELQRKVIIVGLGSTWRRWLNHHYVPHLNGHKSGRGLLVGWMEEGWQSFCRFAAVRISDRN